MVATTYKKPITGLIHAVPALILVLFLALITFITGCETITTLAEHRRTYCDKTTDSLAKDLAIAAIRKDLPYYPAEGICTELGAAAVAAAEPNSDGGDTEGVQQNE